MSKFTKETTELLAQKNDAYLYDVLIPLPLNESDIKEYFNIEGVYNVITKHSFKDHSLAFSTREYMIKNFMLNNTMNNSIFLNFNVYNSLLKGKNCLYLFTDIDHKDNIRNSFSKEEFRCSSCIFKTGLSNLNDINKKKLEKKLEQEKYIKNESNFFKYSSYVSQNYNEKLELLCNPIHKLKNYNKEKGNFKLSPMLKKKMIKNKEFNRTLITSDFINNSGIKAYCTIMEHLGVSNSYAFAFVPEEFSILEKPENMPENDQYRISQVDNNYYVSLKNKNGTTDHTYHCEVKLYKDLLEKKIFYTNKNKFIIEKHSNLHGHYIFHIYINNNFNTNIMYNEIDCKINRNYYELIDFKKTFNRP